MCGYHVLKKEKKKSLKINHNHELGVNTREITWAEKQPWVKENSSGSKAEKFEPCSCSNGRHISLSVMFE